MLVSICLCGRAILQHLCEVGSYEQQSACRQQLEDVQGSLRFVKYELGRKGGNEPKLPTSHLDDIQVQTVDCLPRVQTISHDNV